MIRMLMNQADMKAVVLVTMIQWITTVKLELDVTIRCFTYSLYPIDEDVHDEDNEYLEFLSQQAAAQANDGSELDDEEDEIEEEILFESPLDEIDPYIEFEQVFKGMYANWDLDLLI